MEYIQNVISIIFPLIGAVLVIALTYYGSRWYAKRMIPMNGGKYMKIIDRVAVSKTGSVLIIDIEGCQYMIGVSEKNIQMMHQIEEPILLKVEEEIKPTNMKDLWYTVVCGIKHRISKNEKN